MQWLYFGNHLPSGDVCRLFNGLIQLGSHLLTHHSMQLAPGPSYVLRSFPYFVVPSAIVYATLTLSKERLSLAIPAWLTVVAAVFARPTIFIFNQYYSRFVDSRNAAANNAVLPPHIRQSPFSIISQINESFQKGYPGALWYWPCIPVQHLQPCVFCSRFHTVIVERVWKHLPTKALDG